MPAGFVGVPSGSRVAFRRRAGGGVFPRRTWTRWLLSLRNLRGLVRQRCDKRFSELLAFGRAGKGRGRGLSGGDGLRYLVEVAGANELLVLDGAIPSLFFHPEFGLLHLRVGAHAVIAVGAGQLKHAQVQGVEAGQSDELELVAHLAQFLLEVGNGRVVEFLLPIERRRAVVGQHLAGELGVDAFGELPRLVQVRLRGFAPEHLDVGRIGQAASDGGLQPAAKLEEALYGSRAFDELPVARRSEERRVGKECRSRWSPYH